MQVRTGLVVGVLLRRERSITNFLHVSRDGIGHRVPSLKEVLAEFRSLSRRDSEKVVDLNERRCSVQFGSV
jgi:hypothetical protein